MLNMSRHYKYNSLLKWQTDYKLIDIRLQIRCLTYQQVILWYGQQKFDKHPQCIIKSIISIQSKHTKIDIVSTQCSFQHRKTYWDTFQCKTTVKKNVFRVRNKKQQIVKKDSNSSQAVNSINFLSDQISY